MGWSRIRVYRAKLMSELPRELFELLLAHGVLSSKALAQVASASRRDDPFSHYVERCPHCGGVVRVRAHVNEKARRAIDTWLAALAEPRDAP
jgi:hypothetical protein